MPISTSSELSTEMQRLHHLDQALNQYALVWIRGKEGVITYVNDFACDVTGYTREELLDQSMFFHKQSHYPDDYVIQIFQQVQKDGGWQEEMLCETPTGQEYWLNVSTTPIRNSKNEIVQLISIAHDITQRKNNEASLQRFETGLRKLTALQSDQHLSFKQKAQQALALIADTFQSPAALFIRPLEDPRLSQAFGIAFAIGELRSAEYKTLLPWATSLAIQAHPSISVLPVEALPFQQVWGRPLYDSQNKLLGCFAFFDTAPPSPTHPLFEQRENQEFFELLSQWFASLLEREDFIQRITESNTSKDRLMAILAHDLRSPLSAVSGFTELLLDRAVSHPEQSLCQHQEILEDLQEASQRSLILIQSILEFERLGEKSYVPHFKKILLNHWIKQYLKVPLMQAERYLLSHHLEMTTQALWVELDEPVFARVLSNIVQNACKFTPSGGEIRIQLQKTMLGDIPMAHLEIHDTGIGIPEDKLKFVFSREEQVRRLGLRGEASHGMGLAITRRIVELHKGYVQIKSEENKGTCVSIMLPLTSK